VQENQVALKLNGTYHLPAYADDMNLLGDIIKVDTINKNTETLIEEVGIKINLEGTKHISSEFRSIS
jgi:hypothetical protein